MITHGRIVEVKANKIKDEQVKGMSLNVATDSVTLEGARVKVSYTYLIDYHDDIAKMEIKGELFADANTDFGKKLLDGWKKNKQIAPELAEEILTAITYAGSSIGTLLAFTINVNAPINVPRARLVPPEKEAKKGTAPQAG